MFYLFEDGVSRQLHLYYFFFNLYNNLEKKQFVKNHSISILDMLPNQWWWMKENIIKQ